MWFRFISHLLAQATYSEHGLVIVLPVSVYVNNFAIFSFINKRTFSFILVNLDRCDPQKQTTSFKKECNTCRCTSRGYALCTQKACTSKGPPGASAGTTPKAAGSASRTTAKPATSKPKRDVSSQSLGMVLFHFAYSITIFNIFFHY